MNRGIRITSTQGGFKSGISSSHSLDRNFIPSSDKINVNYKTSVLVIFRSKPDMITQSDAN